MQTLRQLLRVSRIILLLLLGVVLTLWCIVIGKDQSSTYYRNLKRWWSKRAAYILNLNITVQGQVTQQPAVLVANHISWLDMFVLGSVLDIRFLSKAEVRQWPLIGWLADKAGTLFIARGQSGAAKQASQHLVSVIQQGDHVLFFPEGTTTDGTSVRRFHARLFAPAIDAQVAVQPIALYYPDTEGQASPVVPYINDDSLLSNLWRIAGQRQLQAVVTFLDLVPSQDQARKELASACEDQIRAQLEIRQH